MSIRVGEQELDIVTIDGKSVSLETLHEKIVEQSDALTALVAGEGGSTLQKADVNAIAVVLARYAALIAAE